VTIFSTGTYFDLFDDLLGDDLFDGDFFDDLLGDDLFDGDFPLPYYFFFNLNGDDLFDRHLFDHFFFDDDLFLYFDNPRFSWLRAATGHHQAQ
jgi:hypothetical protein